MKGGEELMTRSGFLFALAVLCSTATVHAAIVVHSDFDFEDNTLPPEFSVLAGSSPAIGGGVLTFDGATAVQATIPSVFGGSAPADNYGYEIIYTPTSVSDQFDVLAAISDIPSVNSGNFIFRQDLDNNGPDPDTYNIIESREQAVGGTVTPQVGVTVRLAFVMNGGVGELYVNSVLDTSAPFDNDGNSPIDTGLLDSVVLGGSAFGVVTNDNGYANGTIDRARYFTFGAGEFEASDLIVPEPASFWLCGLSLVGFVVSRRVQVSLAAMQ